MRLRALAALAVTLGTALAAPAIEANAAGERYREYPYYAVNIADLRLRSGPGSYFPELEVMPRKQVLKVINCVPGWCLVTRPNGLTGWVTTDYIVDYDAPRG